MENRINQAKERSEKAQCAIENAGKTNRRVSQHILVRQANTISTRNGRVISILQNEVHEFPPLSPKPSYCRMRIVSGSIMD
jgi:hypothetical protein